MAIQIDILYTKDCTDWEETARLVQQALDDLGLEGDFSYTLVNSDREAMELHFIGSPTVLFDGVACAPTSHRRGWPTTPPTT